MTTEAMTTEADRTPPPTVRVRLGHPEAVGSERAALAAIRALVDALDALAATGAASAAAGPRRPRRPAAVPVGGRARPPGGRPVDRQPAVNGPEAAPAPADRGRPDLRAA